MKLVGAAFTVCVECGNPDGGGQFYGHCGEEVGGGFYSPRSSDYADLLGVYMFLWGGNSFEKASQTSFRILPSISRDLPFSVSAFSSFSPPPPLSFPQAMGSQGNLSAEVEQATRRQVQGMQSSQQRNRERVLTQLLGMVCDVRPQVHPNYRITV